MVQGTGGNNVKQVVESGGSLAQITSPSARLALAEKGLASMSASMQGTIGSFAKEMLKTGVTPESRSIGDSFRGQLESYQKVSSEAAQILEAGRKAGGLDTNQAQRLEELNSKANQIKDNIVELEKQLRFHNKKDDEGPPGAAGAAPMLTVKVEG